MNILFLDIDGVLNSETFYNSLPPDQKRFIPIDRNCVAQVKRIVEATGASIVLTSSWRLGWDPDPERMQIEGRILTDIFSEYGLTIYGKTPDNHPGERAMEIKDWISSCPEKVHRYVIIDDTDYRWDRHHMERHWVPTDYCQGGLGSQDADKAIELFHKSGFYFFMERFSH